MHAGVPLRHLGRRRHALRCLSALDAVNCLVWGPDNDHPEVAARGRRTLDRLMKQAAR
ncbi:hypothetical protein ACFWG7_21760 [Streptomyces koyangensis]|uniref:hypothetical protein n=1 Tax=Streptomyces koyangensis TaxID=188770 RepID=UPI00365E139B